jgi:hypothetical protein
MAILPCHFFLHLPHCKLNAPDEQKIKPTESISISSVHFTLNLAQAINCSHGKVGAGGMTKEVQQSHEKWLLDRTRVSNLIWTGLTENYPGRQS